MRELNEFVRDLRIDDPCRVALRAATNAACTSPVPTGQVSSLAYGAETRPRVHIDVRQRPDSIGPGLLVDKRVERFFHRPLTPPCVHTDLRRSVLIRQLQKGMMRGPV